MKFAPGILAAAALISTLAFVSRPALACSQNGNCDHDKHALGAPAPLLGAGIPGIAIALGYGAYWLTRRRRNTG
jgi:hypothetical protein